MTLSSSDRDAFQAALLKAIDEKIAAVVFSPAQRAEMEKPFHEKHDYYNPALMVGGGATLPFDFIPQLAISDPRITDAQIAAAPKTLSFEFNGKSYESPVRTYKSGAHRAAAWEESIGRKVFCREHIANVQPALEQAMGGGLAIHIGYSGDAQQPPTFLVQAWKKADHGDASKAEMEKIEALANQALTKSLGATPFVLHVMGLARG